jgi:hypothetical protein
MARLARFATIVASLVFLSHTGTTASANSVVTFSGTFGSFDYGNQPAPLNGGSFSGTVTLPSLPGPDQQVITNTALVAFFDSSNNLLFTVGGMGSYDVFTAGASGYLSLTISGEGMAGGKTVDVAPLGLEFDNWSFGSMTGNVKPYGPPNYLSAIEYTYSDGGGTTYFNPVVLGQASVPEPSTLVLGLIAGAGVLVFALRRRSNFTWPLAGKIGLQAIPVSESTDGRLYHKIKK